MNKTSHKSENPTALLFVPMILKSEIGVTLPFPFLPDGHKNLLLKDVAEGCRGALLAFNSWEAAKKWSGLEDEKILVFEMPVSLSEVSGE